MIGGEHHRHEKKLWSDHSVIVTGQGAAQCREGGKFSAVVDVGRRGMRSVVVVRRGKAENFQRNRFLPM